MPFLAVSAVAFVFAFVGSLPLAGPIAVLVVSNAVKGRYSDALRIALGAAVAEGIYAFLAFWGFATFLARYAFVLPISHAVTAAILLSLGIHFLFFQHLEEPKGTREPKGGRFWFGFSVSALNPTLLLTWSAVTTFLFSKELVTMTGMLAVPFGVFSGAGVAVWGVMTVGLLRRFRKHVPWSVLAWVLRGMGVILITVAALSVVALVRYIRGGR